MFFGARNRHSKHHTAQDLRGVVRAPAYPWQINEAGFIKAGHVLELIDIIGSEAAFQYLKDVKSQRVVTASVDRTDFKRPIHPWEIILMQAQVTQAWQSSLEAQVIIQAQNLVTGDTHHVATSHLVFVALDPGTRAKVDLKPFKPRTDEERQLAHAAELRKANRKAEGKVAPFIPIDHLSDNPVIVNRKMTPLDANGMGNVFGGVILDIIDEAGSKAAQRQALGQPVVGVRLDRMSFIAPTYIGEDVEARAIITKTWHTSMEVQVEVDAINPHTNDRRRVASSYLVYVHLGPNGKSSPVPPYQPKTEAQIKRAESADTRRRIRTEEEEVRYESTVPAPSLLARVKNWLGL